MRVLPFVALLASYPIACGQVSQQGDKAGVPADPVQVAAAQANVIGGSVKATLDGNALAAEALKTAQIANKAAQDAANNLDAALKLSGQAQLSAMETVKKATEIMGKAKSEEPPLLNEHSTSLWQTFLWWLMLLVGVICFRGNLRGLLQAVTTAITKGGIEIPNLLKVPPPSSLPLGQEGAATAEGTKVALPVSSTSSPETPAFETDSNRTAAGSESAIALLMEDAWPSNLPEDFFLTHEAAVVQPHTADGRGLFRVRVKLEAMMRGQVREVTRVTYRLHETFSQRFVATRAVEKEFELWLNTYGEFLLVAGVEFQDGTSAILSRYLDLPGRPPD